MPVEASLTPRQLRTIADRVEALTKARIDNQAMGVPATPDVFECRFPSGHRGTVAWALAPLTSGRARERNGNRPVYRYVVDLHAPDGETPPSVEVELHDTAAMSKAVRQVALASNPAIHII